MFEKNEWWIILGAILIGAWYYMKKYGQPGATANPLSSLFGSLVNPTQEVMAATPAQTTTPVLFRPAQPSTGSQMIRVGTFQYVPGSNQYTPVTRYRLA